MSLTGDSGVVAPPEGGDLRRYPSYHLLTRLQGPGRVRKVSVSDAARIAALAVTRGGRRELLLANLIGVASVVELDGLSTAVTISVMDARSWRDGDSTLDAWRRIPSRTAGPRVALDAYAVARVIEKS